MILIVNDIWLLFLEAPVSHSEAQMALSASGGISFPYWPWATQLIWGRCASFLSFFERLFDHWAMILDHWFSKASRLLLFYGEELRSVMILHRRRSCDKVRVHPVCSGCFCLMPFHKLYPPCDFFKYTRLDDKLFKLTYNATFKWNWDRLVMSLYEMLVTVEECPVGKMSVHLYMRPFLLGFRSQGTHSASITMEFLMENSPYPFL